MTTKDALRQRFKLPRVGEPWPFPALARLRAELPPGDVLLFAPSAWEPDVWPLAAELAAQGRLWLPRIAGPTLTVHPVRDLTRDLAPGSFGLREPVTPAESGERIRGVVVPGLVFDAHGGRLGRGKGYYDRVLALLPRARRVAVTFEERVVEAVPMEAHDMPMHVVVTESRTLRVPHAEGTLSRVLAAASDPGAVTVFDLDSTLFSTGVRHLGILREFAERSRDARVRAVAQAATPEDFDWDVEEPLLRAGLTDPGVIDALRAHWGRAFFSDAWADADHPVAGAVAFVQAVARRPGCVVYLTGRAEAQMGPGTRRLLAEWGMPVDGDHTQLWLKPQVTLSDTAWKEAAHADLARLGRVTATFENEPGHANAFARAFPGGEHVLVGHAHSHGAPAPSDALSWIPDFDVP